MYRYVFSALFAGLILFYGITTLIFSVPENYLNISLIEYESGFNSFFYQKWGFFAPPPKANERLYYIFEKKTNNKELIAFEVIEPLLKQKHEKAPFNTKEDLMDYLISNSIHNLTNIISTYRESLDYDTKLAKTESNELEKDKKVNDAVKEVTSFKILLNYSKKIALNNNIKFDDYNVRIKITQIDLPKFMDRYKDNKKDNKEYVVFDSSL